MVKFRWVLTGNIKDYPYCTNSHYDEDVVVPAFVEATFNTHIIGFIPEEIEKVFEFVSGDELFNVYFKQFKDALNMKAGGFCRVYFCDINNMDLELLQKDENSLIVRAVDCDTEKVNFEEKVSVSDFKNAVISSIRDFRDCLICNGSNLLENKYIQDLIRDI